MLPEIVQMLGVAVLKVTGKPDDALARTVPVTPTDMTGATPKVIT
jgi:hypothetical protein